MVLFQEVTKKILSVEKLQTKVHPPHFTRLKSSEHIDMGPH